MTDLETLLVADEDARARLESVRAEHMARREAARAEYESRHHAATEALGASLEAELARIAAEIEADIASRETGRRERLAALETRSAALVEPAAAVWVRILEEGQLP
jgi:hypothetical protein